MTQTIEYVVKVNATQAQAAVADVEKRFGGVDTVVARVDKSIIALERDMKDLNAAIAAGGPNVATYKAQLDQLRTALYGAPGAAGGRGATSGMGAGMAALEASRALEDLQYGIGGVVNNIPSLVMALGMGAGAAGAISVLAVSINQVVKNFTAIDPAAKEAADAAKERVKGLRGEIEGLAKELRALEVGSERAAMEIQAERVRVAAEAAKPAIEAVGGMDRFRRLEDNEKLVGTTADQMEAAKKAMESLDKEMAILAGMRRAQKEKDAQREIELQVDLANAEEMLLQKRNEEAKKRADELSKTRYEMHVAMLEDEDKALAEVAKARSKDEEERLKLQYDMHVAMMDDEDKALREIAKARRKDQQKAESEANRERERDHKRTVDAMKRAEEDLSNYAVGMASMTTNQLASSFTDYLMMKAKGEEHAEKKAVASFLSATGQQLVATGVKGVFEGAIMSANPLTPGAGAGMMVLGGAAIAAGMAMAGGGASVSASIPTEKTDKKAAKDRGASPRGGSGGGGGSGGLVVNVSYGAGGPLPEDIAREIDKVVKSNDRRRGAA